MWVKICATTSIEDALLAAEAGADAVGFVFAASPRQVTAEQVVEITAHLPQRLEKIGVFGTDDGLEILDTAITAELTGVQLHRAYNEDLVGRLRSGARGADLRMTIAQTVHWDITLDAATQVPALRDQIARIDADGLVQAILIDSRTPRASGGTGVQFDWANAASIIASAKTPVIVAGGLSLDNVGDAIRQLRPWGVDVASGVEAEPGRKNPASVRAFVQKAKAARA